MLQNDVTSYSNISATSAVLYEQASDNLDHHVKIVICSVIYSVILVFLDAEKYFSDTIR